MIFGIFTLAVALTISAVAAYYSIAGLCAIFAAAVVPIIIMGAALELGKITATVWLHKFWHRANIQFKLYLIPAIIILMIITSMGIFGFLSKAHMDQTVTVGDSSSKVAILDEKIATEKGNIESAKKALQQMDSQVDQMLSRTTDDKGTNRAVQIRKQQATERKNLQKEITTAQQNIAQLQNERAPLAAETRKIEAEVGPIKYIAALIYGDNPDANLLERAVRWVIILLVLVFDPLALVLILAAEQTIEWARADRKSKKVQDDARQGWHQEWVPDTENPWHDEPKYELDDGPLTDEQIDEINRQANIRITPSNTLFDDPKIKEFFDRGHELARAIDENEGKFPVDDDPLDIPVLENEEMWSQRVIDENPILITRIAVPESNLDVIATPVTDDSRFDPQPIRGFAAPATDEAPINPIPKPVVIHENQIEIPNMTIGANERPANTSFGTEFPSNPQRGDLFLRVDFLPNRSYKWNGQKWIDVNTEHYAYDEEYIKHLIDRIDRGEYSVDLLSETEQEQIQRYLNEQSTRK